MQKNEISAEKEHQWEAEIQKLWYPQTTKSIQSANDITENHKNDKHKNKEAKIRNQNS